MGIGMQNQSALAPGESKVTDLFALSDEQILEIMPEPAGASKEDSGALNADIGARVVAPTTISSPESPVTSHQSTGQRAGGQPGLAVPLEPPAWLAAQMSDAWAGEEAREVWDGVQQARSEAAAYRAAIASPEEARTLKELYPGGVTEARAAADRARLLDDVDRAYFGAAGNSPEQTSASRAQLAQRMLREDPAAFREMVETGIRVLQEAAGSQSRGARSLASAVSDARNDTSGGPTGAAPVQVRFVDLRIFVSTSKISRKAPECRSKRPQVQTANLSYRSSHLRLRTFSKQIFPSNNFREKNRCQHKQTRMSSRCSSRRCATKCPCSTSATTFCSP